MNAVTGILRSTKHEKIAWVRKQLPTILIVLLITADNMVTHSISGHWVPILGFVLGASLMCFGFFQVFPLFSEIRIKEVAGREKNRMDLRTFAINLRRCDRNSEQFNSLGL